MNVPACTDVNKYASTLMEDSDVTVIQDFN